MNNFFIYSSSKLSGYISGLINVFDNVQKILKKALTKTFNFSKIF